MFRARMAPHGVRSTIERLSHPCVQLRSREA
jgi:hypothetical protein